MPQTQKLSELAREIDATIYNRFANKTFWIKAEITDVKKVPHKQWCYLKFIEKDGSVITTEINGVFWSDAYAHILKFEKESQQAFESGIEITCSVLVKFHKRYGIKLEVVEIDLAYAIGKLEQERKKILEQLVKDGIAIDPLNNGTFVTLNNTSKLPLVFQNIALIASANTDGQLDFKKVIKTNKYGYQFSITDFSTQIQGDGASKLILEQLKLIEQDEDKYDVVVIVRGGGSDIDFKSFNDYELARGVATFPIPILTGIGHDRNTSIVDLMARQYKTPTDVANFVVDRKFLFDCRLQEIKKAILSKCAHLLDDAKSQIKYYRRIVNSASPATILKRGFAIVKNNGKIVTEPGGISIGSELETIFEQGTVYSTVTKK